MTNIANKTRELYELFGNPTADSDTNFIINAWHTGIINDPTYIIEERTGKSTGYYVLGGILEGEGGELRNPKHEKLADIISGNQFSPTQLFTFTVNGEQKLLYTRTGFYFKLYGNTKKIADKLIGRFCFSKKFCEL